MTGSSLNKRLARLKLQQRSSMAMAEALRQGSLLLPQGPARRKVSLWAKRTRSCAITNYARIVTRPGEASFIMRSNKRACHGRCCPACEAKRANAAVDELTTLLDSILDNSPGSKPLMLTLTSKNRPVGNSGAELYQASRAMLLDHQRALKAFFAYKRVQSAILGHVTSIECDFATLNGQLTVHWHSHSLLITAPGALSDHRYIRQAEWCRLWGRALGVPYTPIVDIRTIKASNGTSTDRAALKRAAKEVLKYAFDTDIYRHENRAVAVDPRVAVAFAVASYRRRLVSMDRIFLDAKRRLRAARKNSGETPKPHPADDAGYSPKTEGCNR